MKINHPIKGRIDYEPYEFQKELINAILEGKNVIVKSARQMGTSTTMFYCIRELCLKNPGYKALLVTSNGYGQDGLGRFPDDEGIKKRSKFKIEFDNGSEIIFLPGNPTIGEILDDYEVFFDNYEFISRELLINLMQCFAFDGFKPRFYSFTGDNEFQRDGFETIKWNWNLDSKRDGSWKSEQIRILGEFVFKREYEVN